LCLLVVYKTIVQFYTYESLKQLMLLLQNSSARPSTLKTVCYSLFACALYKLSTCCGVTFLLLFFVCGSGFLVARSWHFHLVSSARLHGIFLHKIQSMQLVCGGLAGSTAALFTTPFDVVKTRIQTQVC
jgi:hypothetical protein